MGWKLCTISKASAGNWALCKEHGLWGISQTTHKVDPNRAQVGDRLLFWISSEGFVGYGTVTGKTYAPTSREEIPWPGGLYRWGLLVPFTVDFDCPSPVKLKFNSGKMERTGIANYSLRRGFVAINDRAAEAAVAAIHDVHKSGG